MAAAMCAPCFEDEGYFSEMYDLTADRIDALRRSRIVVLSGYMKRELMGAGLAAHRIAVIPPFVHGLDPDAAPDGPPCVTRRLGGRGCLARGLREAVGRRAQARDGFDRGT